MLNGTRAEDPRRRASRLVAPLNIHLGLWALLILAFAALLLNLAGCASFRRAAPLAVPADFPAKSEAEQLTNPETRRQAYAKLFPALPKIQSSGNLVARGRWWRGKEHFLYRLVALDPGKSPRPRLLRLSGFVENAQVSLFDVIVRDNYMTVALHPARALFQGPIPHEGTPFGRRYGVEPWDLVSVFTIGQEIAAGSFSAKTGTAGNIILEPSGQSHPPGLEHVVLDRATGLPSRSQWKTGRNSYEVRYLGWDNFTDKWTGRETRLLPSRIEIIYKRKTLGLFRLPLISPRTLIQLKPATYQFNPELDERLFRVYVDATYRQYPLSTLKKVLTD